MQIKHMQQNVVPYTNLQMFAHMDTKLKTNITKLESTIMEMKQTKYMRVLQDYRMDNAYTQAKSETRNLVPRLILK